MLSFTSPWALTGLLTIGIPVYLHLYYRRTPIPRDFPSLRLIRQSVEQLYNRMQVRNWILLLLRCLVIFFLVSAFARPFWGAGSGGPIQKGAPTAFVIAIDTSMSMGASYQGISLFNAAKAKAIEILERMGPYDKGAIAVINDPGSLLSPQLTWDKNELKETVRNLPLSWAGTNLGSSLQPALKLLSQVRNTKRTLYVITDLTAQAWKPFTETYDLKRIDKQIDLVLIPIGNETPVNLSVAKLTCDAPVVIKGRSAPVAVTVSNHSPRPQKTILSLYLDGEKKWETPLELDARSSKRVPASCTFLQSGVSQIRATLTGDTLQQDDQRHLAVKVLSAPKILILHPPVDREGRETRDDLYLRFALAPLDRSEGATFQIERRLPEETNTLAFDGFSAIFLVNQRRLSDDLIKRLQDYVMGGGNLVFFLGSRVDPTWYNNMLIDRPGANYLLPARLVQRVGNAVARTIAYRLTDLDVGHPAFRLFSAEENGDPGRAQIFEFFETEPNSSAMILARLSHGLPAIVEERRGQGRVVLVTFNADNSWSDWPLKPTFLPFLHQTLFGLISKAGLSRDSVVPGTPVLLSLRSLGLKRVVLTAPDGKSQEFSPPADNGPIAHFSFTGTEEAGVYKVSIEQNGETRIEAFTVNPPAEESDLQRFDLNKIPRFIPLQPQPGEKEKLGDRIALVREGRELAGTFLLLLLLLALIETFLANRAPSPLSGSLLRPRPENTGDSGGVNA